MMNIKFIFYQYFNKQVITPGNILQMIIDHKYYLGIKIKCFHC